MSNKTTKILSIIFLVLPTLALVVSGVTKIAGGEQIVMGLTKAGFGSYITAFGIAEIFFAVLLWIPATYKVGFYFILSYLGGAAAVEVGGGQFPVALFLIAFAWIGFFFKEDTNFLVKANRL